MEFDLWFGQNLSHNPNVLEEFFQLYLIWLINHVLVLSLTIGLIVLDASIFLWNGTSEIHYQPLSIH